MGETRKLCEVRCLGDKFATRLSIRSCLACDVEQKHDKISIVAERSRADVPRVANDVDSPAKRLQMLGLAG